MRDEFEYLRSGLERIIADDPDLAEEIGDLHPRIVSELPRARRGLEALRARPEAPDAATFLVSVETIVKTKGRPVLTVRDNDFVFETDDSASEVWRSRLDQARSMLRRAIPSVGRVEVANNPDYSWVGTAWLLHEEIAVTNRHVAAEFALARGNEFVFRLEPGFDDPMAADIDFLQEASSRDKRLFKVTKVLYIEPDSGPDIAFLKVERESNGDRLSAPLALAEGPAEAGRFIAAVGYPARDSRVPDQALVSRIFGDIYDKKRLAPGAIRSVRGEIITHDASTLGGNSGSALIDLATGEAVALHRAGLYLQDNYAVPASIVRDRLQHLREFDTFPRPTEKTTAPMVLPAEQQAWNASTPVRQGTALTWTIPLQISVNLGDPVAHMMGAASPSRPASLGSVNEAAATLKQQFEGRSGVVNVRPGYEFENGWITDRRAVVVAVSEAIAGVPDSIAGFPVRVTPASPWDLPEAAALEALLERVPATHYVAPDNVRLEEVDEEMRVICHASPDAGWPTLEAFLEGKINRLTMGIYDFTAPHVVEAVKSAVKKHPSKFNLVIQRGAAMGGEAKEDDIPDEKVVQKFSRSLRSRFKQAWAAVRGPGRLFASSYHIKVAVRDGKAFWLSSGNLQSSNQPDIDPVGDAETTFGPLRSFNREWHVVVENESLARQYEKFLLWDLKQASALAEEAAPPALPMVFVPLEALEREAPEPEVAARAKYFPPLEVARKVRVMPLLTPDNFQEKVLELLKGAKRSVLFQNQSLSSLGENNEPGFRDLLETLLRKQRELDDVRIILRGDFNPAVVLERLKEFGFDTRGDKLRLQKKCHTKGIIVDGKQVLVGSHNWTNQGTLVNRDASLIFHDEEIAQYYRDLFEFDWRHLARARVTEEFVPLELAEPGRETPAGMAKLSLADLLYGDG